jgi:ATP-dependent Clp protease adaptor protein ClpS
MNTTIPKREQGTQVKNKDRTEPLWNVILHNDWDNSISRVVLILKKVSLGMNIRKAATIMYAAHLTGKAVVKRCHKELAELYKELLSTRRVAEDKPGASQVNKSLAR